jgi:hypothetical protein
MSNHRCHPNRLADHHLINSRAMSRSYTLHQSDPASNLDAFDRPPHLCPGFFQDFPAFMVIMRDF